MKMHARHTRWRTTLGFAGLVLTLCGCPTSDDDPPPGQDTEGDSDGAVCDPVGADAEMGMLLNAPVAEDVEVIVKTPQHPGAAGPSDLP